MPGFRDPGPSVKVPEQYEALRRQGESMEKAARIASTNRQAVGARRGTSPAYERWSRVELYDRAREIGIDARRNR